MKSNFHIGHQWRLVAALLLVLPLITVAADQTSKKKGAPAAAAAPASDVDPTALAALDRMGEALRKLQQFQLVSDASTDVVLDSGQKIALDGQVTYRVQRPNRMFVELKSDRRLRQLFYDGNTLTLYSPKLKYYASVDQVDKTLGELAITARDDYGIEFPLADLFFWGTEHVSRDAIKSAIYVGPATIDGEAVDQYAFRQEGADWQLWLSKSSALPQKLVITSRDDPAMPQYSARLHWNTKATSDAKSFTFTPPDDAKRIEIVPIGVAVIESEGK
ncbi:MAG TPA: DUF2092 domain-containing protein [Pseudoxanthomonas sp.]|nr:DUF2092 domain-containing protein [Pseudoxanthomonas sp.]